MLGDSGTGDGRTDWNAWHDDYADPDSALSVRLSIVRSEIRSALAGLDSEDGQEAVRAIMEKRAPRFRGR